MSRPPSCGLYGRASTKHFPHPKSFWTTNELSPPLPLLRTTSRRFGRRRHAPLRDLPGAHTTCLQLYLYQSLQRHMSTLACYGSIGKAALYRNGGFSPPYPRFCTRPALTTSDPLLSSKPHVKSGPVLSSLVSKPFGPNGISFTPHSMLTKLVGGFTRFSLNISMP